MKNMREEIITIPTLDDHLIYGTLITSATKNNPLIIFVHGITGSQYEQHYIRAPYYFCPKGFNVFRFDQYSREKKARRLTECSISIHAQDLNEVVKHFSDEYETIHLVGHSLGALVVLKSDLKRIAKTVLVDPSRGMNNLEEKNITYDKEKKQYVYNRGIEILMGQAMIDEWMEAANLQPYVDKIKQPCKFIFAGNSELSKRWIPHIKGMEQVTVPGAGHCFYEIGTTETLFEEIYAFLKK